MILFTVTVAALVAGYSIILRHKKNLIILNLKVKIKVLQEFADSTSIALTSLEEKSFKLLQSKKDYIDSLSNEVKRLTYDIEKMNTAVKVPVDSQNAKALVFGGEKVKKKVVNTKK